MDREKGERAVCLAVSLAISLSVVSVFAAGDAIAINDPAHSSNATTKQGELQGAVGKASPAKVGSVTDILKKGDDLMARMKVKESIEQFREAVRIAPDNAKAHQRLGCGLSHER